MARKLHIAALVTCLLLVPALQASEVSDMVTRASEHFQMAEMEQAQALLEQALSLGISPEEALQARNDAGTRVFLQMLRDGALNAPMKKILDLASEAEMANLTSPDVLRSLVKDLESDFTTRQLALQKLAGAGDVAVPFLLEPLADRVSTERRTYAQMAITRLGTKALWPICAALATDDAMLRANLCVALGNIGDSRALPYLKQLLDDPDQLEDVTQRARESISRIAPKKAGRLPDAPTLFCDSAETILKQLPRDKADFDPTPNRTWWWENGSLRHQELAASFAKAEIARAQSLRAIEINPESTRADSLFLASTLAFSLLADQAPDMPDAVRDGLRRHVDALSVFGPDVMASALKWFMDEEWDDAVLLCLEELRTQLVAHSTISPPRQTFAHLQPVLAEAMHYPTTLVRAAAMNTFSIIAIEHAAIESAPELVAMAIAALNAGAAPAALVAVSNGETRNRFTSALREGGFDVVEAKTPAEALESAGKRPQFHALVAEEGFSRSRNQLLQLPSLRRAAVFVIAQSPTAKGAKATWPGSALLFAGSEAPELIVDAVRKAAGTPLTEKQAHAANSNAASVLLTISRQTGGPIDKHIQDLESLAEGTGLASSAAVAALAATGKPEALSALDEASKSSPDPRTRSAALLGITLILRQTSEQPDRFLPSLLEAAGDDDRFVASTARIAIGFLDLQPGRAAAIYQGLTADLATRETSE